MGEGETKRAEGGVEQRRSRRATSMREGRGERAGARRGKEKMEMEQKEHNEE